MDTTLASLRLSADELDPGQVSRILHRQAEVAARKGERLYPTSRSQAMAKTGIWFWSLDGHARQPQDFLQDLVDIYAPHADVLKAMFPSLQVMFFLYVPDSFSPQDIEIVSTLLQHVETLGQLSIAPF